MRRIVLALLALISAQVFADSLLITEFSSSPTPTYQAARGPQLAEQSITIVPASSVQSAAFTGGLIRLQCAATASTVCKVTLGGINPTATSASMQLTNGQTEYFRVDPGAKLAVFQ